MEQFLLPTESFIQLNKRSAPSKQLAIGEICGSKFTKVGENMCRFTSPFTAPSDFFRRDVTVLPHLSRYPRHKKPDLCFQREKDPTRKIDSLSVPHSCRLFISSHLHQFLLSSLTSVTNTHTHSPTYTHSVPTSGSRAWDSGLHGVQLLLWIGTLSDDDQPSMNHHLTNIPRERRCS